MVLVNVLAVALLMATIWFLERIFVSKRVNISPVIANILAGILLGPALFGLMPDSVIETMKLLGKIGVMMLVLEAGNDLDKKEVMIVGAKSFVVGATGVVGPLAIVMCTYPFIFPYGYLDNPAWKVALSVGSCFSPTSLGFSAQILKGADYLRTRNGVLICCAAVVDDIISLCLLGEIEAFRTMTTWGLIEPAMGMCVTVLGCFILAIILQKWIMPAIPDHLKGFLGTAGMFGFSLLFGWLGAFLKSSDLVGCFVVGVAFSDVKEVHAVWDKHVAAICMWMTRIFFAASIGFNVPYLLGSFTLPVLARVCVVTFAGVAGKCILGFYARPFNWVSFNVLGWGMGGRGEFSFLIAKNGYLAGLTSDDDFFAAVVGLVICSTATPVAMRYFLRKHKANEAGLYEATDEVDNKACVQMLNTDGDETTPLKADHGMAGYQSNTNGKITKSPAQRNF